MASQAERDGEYNQADPVSNFRDSADQVVFWMAVSRNGKNWYSRCSLCEFTNNADSRGVSELQARKHRCSTRLEIRRAKGLKN